MGNDLRYRPEDTGGPFEEPNSKILQTHWRSLWNLFECRTRREWATDLRAGPETLGDHWKSWYGRAWGIIGGIGPLPLRQIEGRRTAGETHTQRPSLSTATAAALLVAHLLCYLLPQGLVLPDFATCLGNWPALQRGTYLNAGQEEPGGTLEKQDRPCCGKLPPALKTGQQCRGGLI